MPYRTQTPIAGHEGRWRWLLFLPGLLILAATAIVALSEGFVRLSPTAEAAGSRSEAWSFVPDALSSLSATAVQVCAAEAALQSATTPANQSRWQEQQVVLEARYDEAAQTYNQKVADTIAAGNTRPWDVAPIAPVVEVSIERSCLKPPPVPAVDSGGPEGFSIAPSDRFLTLAQLDAAAKAAGWPMENGWWPQMRQIIQCETASLDRFAHNTSDPNGGSYGLAQLNGTQHFEHSGENFNQWSDPVVNLRVALWLRRTRGHFGGSGGWMICAARWGIA